jgi:hypothetical protein
VCLLQDYTSTILQTPMGVRCEARTGLGYSGSKTTIKPQTSWCFFKIPGALSTPFVGADVLSVCLPPCDSAQHFVSSAGTGLYEDYVGDAGGDALTADQQSAAQCGPITNVNNWRNLLLDEQLEKFNMSGHKLHWYEYTAEVRRCAPHHAHMPAYVAAALPPMQRWDMHPPPFKGKSDCTHMFPTDVTFEQMEELSKGWGKGKKDIESIGQYAVSSLLYEPLWDELALQLFEWLVRDRKPRDSSWRRILRADVRLACHG